jgi:hypothetical protein
LFANSSSRAPDRAARAEARSGLEELTRQAAHGAQVSALTERRRFGILRGSPERLPTKIRVTVQTFFKGSAGGLHLRSAQLAPTGEGGAWVVSGKGIVCLLPESLPALQCNLLSEALAQGVSIGIHRSRAVARRRFVVLGIAPDWASAVLMRVGKQTRRVRVRHNAYAARASSPILFVRLISRWRRSRRLYG